MPLVRGSVATDVPSSDSCCGSRPRCPAPTHELTAPHGIIRALSDDGLRGSGPVQLCTVNRLAAPGEGLHRAMELDTRVAHSALPLVMAAERAVTKSHTATRRHLEATDRSFLVFVRRLCTEWASGATPGQAVYRMSCGGISITNDSPKSPYR